ncbi:MAG: hypothetical protein WKF36_06125 [Candidatus Nitrosocosmicus sp.]
MDTYCGQLLTAIVPDSVHTEADRLKREGILDLVPMNVKCTACKKDNNLYWYRPTKN